jgi:hypothetical protein
MKGDGCMKDVKVIFKEANQRDPLSVYPTVGIRAEIAGKEYSDFVELDYEPSATEVCNAIQLLLDLLEEAEMNVEKEKMKI